MKKNLIEYLESEGQSDNTGITVVWQRADTINGNGRLYPRSVLEKEINRINSKIASGETIYGQAFHPEDGFGRADQLTHEWKKVWMEPDGTCKGVISLLDTDKGKDIKAILRGGRRLGISSRGIGSVTEKEIDGRKVKEVQPDFKLLSPGDWVVAPSVQGAGNIQESLLLMEEKMNEKDAEKDKEPENINLFTEEELIEVLKSEYERQRDKGLFFGSWREWRLANENKIRRELGFKLNQELAEREKTYHLYREAKLAGWAGTFEEFQQKFPQKSKKKLEERVKASQKRQQPYKPSDLYLEAMLAGEDPAKMADRLNKAEGLVKEERQEESPREKVERFLKKKYKPSIYDWREFEEEPEKPSLVWERMIAGEPRKK